MLRKMLGNYGRYERGNTHDYPRHVWGKIADDLMKSDEKLHKAAGGDSKKALSIISEEVDINTSLQSATRGPIKQRQRLGSPPRVPTRV